MSYVFISHASEDKPRIKPLVKSLAVLGVSLWVDRPGAGSNDLNLSNEEIENYRIGYLRAGVAWDEQLKVALHNAGAVLGCLSKNSTENRQILDNELVFSSISQKLVTCIVDDLEYGMIDEFGLARLSSAQSDRIDCNILDQALSLWEQGACESSWPENVEAEWNKVKKIKSDLESVLADRGLYKPNIKDLEKAKNQIGRIPIGPPIAAETLPFELIEVFSEILDTKGKALSHISTAMEILWSIDSVTFTKEQILIRAASLPSVEQVGGESFWTDAFLSANQKSRRTLAALVLTPVKRLNLEHLVMKNKKVGEFIRKELLKDGW